MANQQTYRVTLKMTTTEWGMFESIRILKGKSSINEDMLDKINLALQTAFIPAPIVKTNIAIGDDAEQKVMYYLRAISETNIDFEVNDTSNMLNHGDMAIIHCGKRICVEVKNYSKPVPLIEVTKYHKSLAHVEYDCGIMIQMSSCGFMRECGIRTPIDFKIDNGKPSIYLSGVDLSILYQVINLLIVFLQTSAPTNRNELERQRRNLLSIYEQVCSLRTMIEHQKKIIAKMETAVDTITSLSTHGAYGDDTSQPLEQIETPKLPVIANNAKKITIPNIDTIEEDEIEETHEDSVKRILFDSWAV